MQERSKIYKIKHQLPLKPRQSTSSLSNQAMWMATPSSKLKRAASKTQGFSMTKDNTPPETKVKHKLSLKNMP
jgi:hypothetical protein